MNRRAILVLAAGTTAGLAGCLDPGSDDGTPTVTDESTDGGTPTPTADPDGQPTPTGEETETPAETAEPTSEAPKLVDREMEIVGSECGGSGEDQWEVDVDDGVVTVDGTIGGNNACYSARIASAEYDEETDVFEVLIESYDDSGDDEACADCILDIFYRATFEFEGGEPGEVDVQHDGTESRSGSGTEDAGE